MTRRPRVLDYALALAGLLPQYLLRWRMNLLSLPDDEARALGIDSLTGRVVTELSGGER